MDNFYLSGLSEAASRVEHAILWNDADQQLDECEDDAEQYEDDVDWHTGDCDDELGETAYLVLREVTQHILNSLMATWKTLMRPHLKCMHQQAAVFKKHVSFCLVFKSARGHFLVVGTGAFDGLAQPSTDRKLAKSRGKGKKGKRKGTSSSQKGGKSPHLGTRGILPKQQTSRSESRPPMSKKRPTEVATNRGGPHHALRLRLDQCMLCRQVGHRASECPNKGKATCPCVSGGQWRWTGSVTNLTRYLSPWQFWPKWEMGRLRTFKRLGAHAHRELKPHRDLQKARGGRGDPRAKHPGAYG